uniref:Uncharacterized protein n=1 Tax=Meloidogyne enterolobii TaxID=390850 RepID=A0A6V7WAX4_MELEN|nr:unnamed protein product [Meloidogyne enterolobii]
MPNIHEKWEIEEITEIAKDSIENGGIKLQKNEASKYLKKISDFSEIYKISYNSVKVYYYKIRNNLIAEQEKVNKETMQKELSKGKSKQKIEEINGNVCIKKSFNLKFL